MPKNLFTADQYWVRNTNRAVILEVLMKNRTLSRAKLAELTGLNPSTVSNIVNSLLAENLLLEADYLHGHNGRPSRLLELNPAGGCAIGVEYDVDFISLILTDITARIIWRKKISIDPGDDESTILNQMFELVDEGLSKGNEKNLKPLGIGVGISGLVDLENGEIKLNPNLRLSSMPIRKLLSDRFQIPIYVENDANAAALGEYLFGAARAIDNFIYLICSRGIGAGIIIDGKILRGSRGFAGELGHMIVDPNGNLCGCGQRGCWEASVTSKAVVQWINNQIAAGCQTTFSDTNKDSREHITYDAILFAANNGDKLAVEALTILGRNLGLGLWNIINAFDPELIILGGTINQASDYVIPVIKEVLRENSFASFHEHVKVAPSSNGADACLLGTIALVIDGVMIR